MTEQTNNHEVTLEDLATMVKGGFDSVDKRFDAVNERFEKMEKTMKEGFEKNVREHEAIQLRLDNVAHRFEFIELQKRVEVLEKTVGVKK